ncbi:9264_t:CDS:2, partial [Cetraspora pellucida]
NGQFHIIDKAVYKLFLELHSHNIPVLQDMLKTKALSIYEQLKNSGIEFLTTFEAFNSWVSGFQRRFDISLKTISEESKLADKAAIESLYFHLEPNKTLASKSDTAKEYKKDKSHLTILLCYNVLGTQKFKLFVIDKSACPKCIKYTNMSKLPLTILLADNCNAYSSPKLQNIKLEFLPPNTTSVIQPCNAGIIKNFKVNYHKLLVTKWINEVENGKSIEPINIKEAIYMISDAWKQQLLEELEMSYDYIKLSAEKYVEVDKHLQIMDIPTEESIVQDILKEQDLINDEDSNNEANNEEEEEIINDLVSYNEEKKALKVAKKYLEQSQFATKDDIYLLQQIIKKAESFY